jgi:hypothetical protein
MGSVDCNVNGWYIDNNLFGGLIGMLIVDPITGAMYKLSPDKLDASLEAADQEFVQGRWIADHRAGRKRAGRPVEARADDPRKLTLSLIEKKRPAAGPLFLACRNQNASSAMDVTLSAPSTMLSRRPGTRARM